MHFFASSFRHGNIDNKTELVNWSRWIYLNSIGMDFVYIVLERIYVRLISNIFEEYLRHKLTLATDKKYFYFISCHRPNGKGILCVCEHGTLLLNQHFDCYEFANVLLF